jgi:hypothetical protein
MDDKVANNRTTSASQVLSVVQKYIFTKNGWRTSMKQLRHLYKHPEFCHHLL